MTFGPAVGNVGMYVAREMLISVPEDQRQAYLRMVEEISDLKYQLGVEVARQLPRLLAEHDSDLVARYLSQVKEVSAAGWKSGVEVAKQLPDLYDAPDETLAGSYVEIVVDATKGPPEDTETAQLAAELERLERELREMEPKVKRAQELKSQLAARDRRDEAQTFALYTAMGLATTAVFWGTELAFHWAFGTDAMRYLGGVLGLVAGYGLKYQLDKRYVFTSTA